MNASKTISHLCAAFMLFCSMSMAYEYENCRNKPATRECNLATGGYCEDQGGNRWAMVGMQQECRTFDGCGNFSGSFNQVVTGASGCGTCSSPTECVLPPPVAYSRCFCACNFPSGQCYISSPEAKVWINSWRYNTRDCMAKAESEVAGCAPRP